MILSLGIYTTYERVPSLDPRIEFNHSEDTIFEKVEEENIRGIEAFRNVEEMM